MGAWLSLHPPGTHGYSFCSKGFKSMLKAVGGHQNAHRNVRYQMKMQKVYMEIMEEERRKEIREGKRIQHSPNCPNNTGEGEIDLELRLGINPAPKIEFFEFLPVLKGYGDAVQTHPNQNMMFHCQLIERPPLVKGGVLNEDGVGVGSSYFVNQQGRRISSKNAFDLTLRL
ncbi:putative transcriptional regulator SUPERMAN-like [Sesbania bispinosa]|nr:putative transcriptional regulator SUPERMAN-like [Sesbania bispinosa]